LCERVGMHQRYAIILRRHRVCHDDAKGRTRRGRHAFHPLLIYQKMTITLINSLKYKTWFTMYICAAGKKLILHRLHCVVLINNDRNVDKHDFINKKTIFNQNGSCWIILCEFFLNTNFQLYANCARRLFVVLKHSSKLKPEYVISKIKLFKQFNNIDANNCLLNEYNVCVIIII